ncbi:MAG: DNA polymerase III subunit delta [Candidatus Dormibacteria bacterium]
MASSSDHLLLVHGEERHLVDSAVRAWMERVRERSPQLDIEVHDAPSRLDALRRSLAEVPLLDPERCVLVRDAPQLGANTRRGADSADALAAALRERAPTTSVCLVAHLRVAPQHPVLAAIKSLRGTVAYFSPPKGRELRSWLDAEIRKLGLRLGPGSADVLLQVAGTDLGVLSSELDKLAAYASGRPLSSQDVGRAVAGDEPVEMWAVLEQLLGPQPARGVATLESLLAEGRSTQHLLSILAGQLRDLIAAQSFMRLRGSALGLAGELRMPEWRAERLARQARRVAPATAASWLRALHEVDRGVKAGEIGDQDGLRLVALRAARDVGAGALA